MAGKKGGRTTHSPSSSTLQGFACLDLIFGTPCHATRQKKKGSVLNWVAGGEQSGKQGVLTSKLSRVQDTAGGCPHQAGLVSPNRTEFEFLTKVTDNKSWVASPSPFLPPALDVSGSMAPNAEDSWCVP